MPRKGSRTVEDSGFPWMTDAAFGEGDGESGGMGALFGAAEDGFVGDEPVVSAATFVHTVGVSPAADVGFVLVGDTDGAAVDGDVAGFGEVEDVLVAVVDEAFGIDGFEVAGADLGAVRGLDGDGFDPVEGVLEDPGVGVVRGGEGEDDLVWEEGVFGGGADVEEERAVGI